MSDTDHLFITPNIIIPLAELTFRFVRSRGPGGQHVNKAATQVELTFDVVGSPSLNDTQKRRIRSALKNLIDKNGVLHLESQSTRSQLRNRHDVSARFQSLLRTALRPRKKRLSTQPTAAARERRLEKKKRRGALKRVRRTPVDG
ncbi:MAG TPA: alternative ribosome rescue aminoacyl-tRNA hydrolase ArfB [Anaerolineae bacterium]|nr:alternative ribosome rescue aminoacyl-tRNA hydrolase ArfB [Anaerolineae bacterium]